MARSLRHSSLRLMLVFIRLMFTAARRKNNDPFQAILRLANSDELCPSKGASCSGLDLLARSVRHGQLRWPSYTVFAFIFLGNE